jgi:hypothetical protein
MTARAREWTAVPWIAAAFLWLTALLLLLSTAVFTNDHFDRISRARQAARYGELPFRDFLDPGYFMTVLSAAGLQRVVGDNLLGEFLLDATFIATGTTMVFWLVARITRSLPLGVFATTIALLTLPRFYDFDKVLFYPLGVFLCWRYIERPSRTNAVLLGMGLVAGAVFRYDTGVYVGIAAVVGMTVVHWREWRLLGQQLVLLAASTAAVALPFVVFIQMNGGVAQAADQIVTYALRERDRTRISTYPRFSIGPLAAMENVRGLIADPGVENTEGIDRARSALPPDSWWTRLQRSVPLLRVRLLPGSWNAENGSAFLYYLLFLLPVAGALASAIRGETQINCARVLSLAAMCLVLDLLILRDPISARVGGMAAPATVMAAWLGWRAWRTRRTLARGLVFVLLGLTIWSIGLTADWSMHLRADRLTVARLQENLRAMAHSPPALDTMSYVGLHGLVTYVRECTSPYDRVYASWFVPELYFYAQRAFAAGLVVTFGGHWSEPRYEERIVSRFAEQSVPIVIIDTRSYHVFTAFYPTFDRYLQAHYDVAGETDFGNSDVGPTAYRVLVRNDRLPLRTHDASGMPCFNQRP